MESKTQNIDKNEKNFYQKIATNSQNDGSRISCEYFETLQHKAGIQSNRKNGYYVKPIERPQQEQKQEIKNQENELGIDDIFMFDEYTTRLNQAMEETNNYSLENFADLSDNDFYNDYFASDDEIDNEENNRIQYQQNYKQAQESIKTNKTIAYANNIKTNIVQNLNQPIMQNQNTTEESENKRTLIIMGIIGCIVAIVICGIILVSLLNENKNKEEKLSEKQNVESSSQPQEKPSSAAEIITNENSILCFSLMDIKIYENENLNNPIDTLEKHTLILVHKNSITNKTCKTSQGYLESNKLYLYEGTKEEFNEETLKFFEDVAEQRQTISITNAKVTETNEDGLQVSENTEEVANNDNGEFLVELQTGNKDMVKTDQYIINFNTNSNFSLLGDLGEKIDNNSSNRLNNEDSKQTQTTISLYNGQKYGKLIIKNANINADLHYGASQKNIDLYDTCSSESFGVPGGGKAILIGGHNTNSLVNLTNVKVGDIITISTSYGTFEYEVFYTGIGKIVTENVLASDYLKDIETQEEIFSIKETEEILGIYTCYQNPNDDITPTPYRFAVKAIKVGSKSETSF